MLSTQFLANIENCRNCDVEISFKNVKFKETIKGPKLLPIGTVDKMETSGTLLSTANMAAVFFTFKIHATNERKMCFQTILNTRGEQHV